MPEGPRAGEEFLGRGSHPHPHQLEGLEEHCKSPSRARGTAPAAKRFLAFYEHYIAFPSISVASGYVPVAKYCQSYIM